MLNTTTHYTILGSVLHTLLKLKYMGFFFFFFFFKLNYYYYFFLNLIFSPKKTQLTRRFESDARGDRKRFFFGA